MREIWADNAKAIGIFLMVLGHNVLANDGVFDFIYSFHMPLFFILSGYFSSAKQELFLPYLKKNVKALLVPYVVFYLLTLPFGMFVIWAHPYNHPYDGWLEFIMKPLIGLFTVKTTSFAFHTNGPSWFFVALFIVKLLFYIPKKYGCCVKSLTITTTVCLIGYFVLKENDYASYARFNTALIAFPLFVFGYLLNTKTNIIARMKESKVFVNITVSLCCAFVCLLITNLNGHVEFSAAGYGNNMILMYLAAIFGFFFVIGMSISTPINKYILTIGGGTSVVLGLHSPIQQLIKEMTRVVFHIPTHDYSIFWAFPMTVVVLICHLPIIYLLNHKYPFLIGKYRKNESYESNTYRSR